MENGDNYSNWVEVDLGAIENNVRCISQIEWCAGHGGRESQRIRAWRCTERSRSFAGWRVLVWSGPPGGGPGVKAGWPGLPDLATRLYAQCQIR
jgi:hypothetical protein